MIVLVLTAVPPGLRGHLTRWLLEISAGVFVGKVNPKVRDLLWERCVDMIDQGRAILVFQTASEQGLAFRVHGHHWKPVDFEGVSLMLRPAEPSGDAGSEGSANSGRPVSNARRRRTRPRGAV